MTVINVSVVIPVRNEEQTLPELLRRIVPVLESCAERYEVIFVTDVNTDHTVEVLRKANQLNSNIKMIKLSNSFGQHIAVLAGLRASSGDRVVVMDGDLQDYPEDIPSLLAKMEEGYDVVYGVKERKNESVLRNFFSRTFVHIINALSDRPLDHNTSMFRAMSRRTVHALSSFQEQEPVITGLVSLIGYPTTNVLVTSGERHAGRTNYSFLRQINLAINFLLAFSTKPLRMVSVLGLSIAALSFAYLAVVLFQTIFVGVPVAGWPTLAGLITLLSGAQIFVLGVIGEYIGRIFLETKHRPPYMIEESLGDLICDTSSRP